MLGVSLELVAVLEYCPAVFCGLIGGESLSKDRSDRCNAVAFCCLSGWSASWIKNVVVESRF